MHKPIKQCRSVSCQNKTGVTLYRNLLSIILDFPLLLLLTLLKKHLNAKICPFIGDPGQWWVLYRWPNA
ncbi:hypothetical protein XELAEV_18014245mg [Xenopus laevis]|uniref:Uncharacterized protein n=1 Tax=Xenopus laevis TaxID=8355 RepID=A0A974HV40_XENLA|nr:hypothetical protein XELAEV_18014245mg [Xenopus laevis]